MQSVSVVIVVKGAPEYLFKTLDSLENFATEIVIIDIGIASDLKIQLQQKASVQIFPVADNVPYVELVRERSKQYAKYDWIMFLDPDEALSQGLKQELQAQLNKNNYDYFQIPRQNLIFGRWIEHSRWWPDYQIRLFRRKNVIWPTQLHAQPKCHGQGLKLQAREDSAIFHHNYLDIDEYMGKMVRYAKSQAQEFYILKKDLNLNSTVKDALGEFIGRFFAAKGYKDGMHGFVLALLQMFYCFLVYFYYWELRGKPASQENLKNISEDFFRRGLLETSHWRNHTFLEKIKRAIWRRLI